jgi:hypothetical protein
MKFPLNYIYKLLFFFIILFIIFSLLYKFNIKNFIGKLNYKLYIYSSILCTILFLLFLYILLNKTDLDKNIIDSIYQNILFIIIFSILWVISSKYFINIFNYLFLLLLCMFNYYLLNNILNIKENNVYKKYISIISIFYLLFHHFFIDFILWNYYHK